MIWANHKFVGHGGCISLFPLSDLFLQITTQTRCVRTCSRQIVRPSFIHVFNLLVAGLTTVYCNFELRDFFIFYFR